MKLKKILTATILFLALGGCATTQGQQSAGNPRDAVDRADRVNRQAQDTRWDMERVGRSSDPFDKVDAVLDTLGDLGSFGK